MCSRIEQDDFETIKSDFTSLRESVHSKDEAGYGFYSVVMRSNVALVAASVEDMRSIVMLCGKKVTVSEFRDELAVEK